MRFILALLLGACLLDMPYGYYQAVRVVATVVLGYHALKETNENSRIILIMIVILFQPLFKISLGRTIWNIVDILVALWLLFIYQPSTEESS